MHIKEADVVWRNIIATLYCAMAVLDENIAWCVEQFKCCLFEKNRWL